MRKDKIYVETKQDEYGLWTCYDDKGVQYCYGFTVKEAQQNAVDEIKSLKLFSLSPHFFAPQPYTK